MVTGTVLHSVRFFNIIVLVFSVQLVLFHNGLLNKIVELYGRDVNILLISEELVRLLQNGHISVKLKMLNWTNLDHLSEEKHFTVILKHLGKYSM